MNEWLPLLACPTCVAPLRSEVGALRCDACARAFRLEADRVYFLDRDLPAALYDNPDAATMVHAYRRPNPLLRAARRLITSEYFPGKAWREARRQTLAGEGFCLVIGSGVSRYPRALHLDLDDYDGVDITPLTRELENLVRVSRRLGQQGEGRQREGAEVGCSSHGISVPRRIFQVKYTTRTT